MTGGGVKVVGGGAVVDGQVVDEGGGQVERVGVVGRGTNSNFRKRTPSGNKDLTAYISLNP